MNIDRVFFRIGPMGAAVLLCATLVGCADYLDRRETVAFGAGDAVAGNRAIHTIDPWPRRSFNVVLPASGARLHAPIDRYRQNAPGPKGNSPASATTGNAN